MSKHEESENDFKEKILSNIRITPGTLQNKSYSESFGLKTYLQVVNTNSIDIFHANVPFLYPVLNFLNFTGGMELNIAVKWVKFKSLPS